MGPAVIRISVATSGAEANGASFDASISSSGEFAVFASEAFNLSANDQNSFTDVFMRDIEGSVTSLVSANHSGLAGNAASFGARISADGNRVAFLSYATDLVTGDQNGRIDIFVRDLPSNTMSLVSVATSGEQGSAESRFVDARPALSADGRFVAFSSLSGRLVSSDTNDLEDIFVRDTLLGTTVRASVGADGIQSDGASWYPSLSADGRYLVFATVATNLAGADARNSLPKVILRDLHTGTTSLVARSASGAAANGPSFEPNISPNGRLVTFVSSASNLADDIAGMTLLHVYVRDLGTGTTQIASKGAAGEPANGSSRRPTISSDGRLVSYASAATNLDSRPDLNDASDVFMAQVSLGRSQRVSSGPTGLLGLDSSALPQIATHANAIVFQSQAMDLVAGDLNFVRDVFVAYPRDTA